MDMDYIKYMSISNDCTCSIGMSRRYIIDVGLNPVIQKMATITAASLTNYKLFGHYEVDYIFTLGNPFNLCPSSIHYNTYHTQIQRELDIGIYSKGKDAQGFALQESLAKLSIPITQSKPYMYDRLISGTLCQVSRETYGIRLIDKRNQFQKFYTNDCTTMIPDDGSYLVVLKKGQQIPITGFTINLRLGFEYAGCIKVGKYFFLKRIYYHIMVGV